MIEPRPVPLEEQIACVERELVFRERVYPRWVRDGKLLELTADLEMLRMRAVLATLKGLRPDLFAKEKTEVTP